MQPPHLSCPSSSTSTHASSHISHSIHSLLQSAGFSKSSSQAIQLLTEVFERYLLLLASTSQHHSNHVGRRVATMWDVERSLNDLGTSTEEIQRWFDEEGGDVAGRWSSGEQEERGEMTRVGQLRDRLSLGKVPASERGALTMHYETVDAQQRSELEAIVLTDEGEEEEESEGEEREQAALTPPPPYARGQSSVSQESIPTHPPTYKRRKLSAATIEYVPFFLPEFPTASEDETGARETDAEYERERERRVQMGEEKRELLQEGGETEGRKEEQEARALAAMEMAPAPKRASEDNWQSLVDFASSTLATQQSIDDIPEAIGDEEEEEVLEGERAESSHRIFANDYLALVSEANAVPPSFLTPKGSAYANAFNQRRIVATMLADPSKFVPCDTIFAAIDVRPSAMPFQPGPSLLITPPTNSLSAPTFTPVRAGGREMISTSTMNNALYPICKHRIANNVHNSSLVLSGGTSGEIYRRVTRIHDPIPILDEQHAERVFHGIQAPKELLSESNSYLREALDVLKIKRAEDIKAGIGGEQQSQLSLSSGRDKSRVKSGTLVQTWDWVSRDYSDSVLPGKKFRAATTGVTTSGGTGGGGGSGTNVNNSSEVADAVGRATSRHRPESLQTA